ncbi:methylcrotonoyl-CoA carboxylase subunit alpha, mitochondrial isoform X1 [Amborella trichopoda]|uniref:methylcrotonoyl-CoA carboxylase subunit alpha, mitochondrial isoform X1 n=1 Tax=Amborella trichopoda TaxID=13333 RepID=UPI0009BDBD18|nr:methylcrotonoyl-CoA carboxylase subunit alpha, mitochondrial isoform X1 [Amborella trichopoda]|eukprot:XP_020520154.1 methylcrotonoyl-CoA carboxylase subunit alpha, mitochondrial isoform X1 [Amborella trichopoda]
MASVASPLLRRNPKIWLPSNYLFSFNQKLFLSATPEIQRRSIDKILIANRGEIACRVMRTAKRLGMRTVAIFSDADKGSLHAKSADEALHIGPPAARLSYLNASAIIQAAIKTGAQAIHPGYGFLSESAEFAELCENAGLIFIGPPASAIRDMGDKSASKRIMGAAGVPLVPGYHGDQQEVDLLKAEADKIGYPVMIKPTHGGGGKGMRIVQSEDEFIESLLGAQREAAASFGVNTVLVEKYISRPRHIEVQVFGDKLGSVIHLNERDCSVQRRHQKIIEEAPAPNITDKFRSELGEAAVSAAKAVNYYNAGTVEFIVDTLTDQFYFMEMNTRLQVEHPVTEMIVGQDLVEWQIRVANGEPLPLIQSEVPLNGHAFEARIYAENVPKGFLPAAGFLHHYNPFPCSPTVRVETGVEVGDSVSVHYDPMIAKLVVWGQTRNAALVKLRDCLSDFQVAGVPTNINFLQRLSSHEAFEKGQVETHFIEHFKGDLLLDASALVEEEAYQAAKLGATLVAACICKMEQIKSKEAYDVFLTGKDKLLHLWYAYPPFRVNHSPRRAMELEWQSEITDLGPKHLKLVVTYETDGNYCVKTEDSDNKSPGVKVSVLHLGHLDFRVSLDGLSTSVSLALYSKDGSKHMHIWHNQQHHHFMQSVRSVQSIEEGSQHKQSFDKSHTVPQGTVVAPMAGLVVKVLVSDGSRVEHGQPVLVMEAMKMEHVVRAPCAGYVRGLQVGAGQQVFDTTILFRIEDK